MLKIKPPSAATTEPADVSSTHPNYLRTLGQDAPAGLVVFLVALPLCLGISLASGAPLLAGVITGIVGGVVVSWLSGSHLSVSGPAAGLTAIIVGAINTLGSYEAVVAATIMAGALQIILGAAKAGIIGLYFPTSVIRGMLAAIGLILILKQIPHFLGADTDHFADMNFLQFDGENTFSAIVAAANSISWGSALIGAISLLVLMLWDSAAVRRIAALRLVPGALIAVILSIGLNLLLGKIAPSFQVLPEHLVKLPIITSFTSLVAELPRPDWSAFTKSSTYVVAFTIGIVASLESLLSVEAVDKLDPHKRITPPNRELMAQGAGNMIAGFLGGLPLTAVIVRSSANVNSGGQTRMSSFIHGLLLLLSLLLLAPILNRIPLSALAAILLVVGFRLTKPALYRMQWKLGWQQFLPFIATIVAILFTDLLKGVTIGLAVGIFYILKANYESAFYMHEETPRANDIIHLKLAEHVSFLNKASIVKVLNSFPAGSHVVLDGSGSASIDYDVLEAIESFRLSAQGRGIELELLDIPQVHVLGH